MTFWKVDILGVDVSGVDILGVDILGVDILGRTHRLLSSVETSIKRCHRILRRTIGGYIARYLMGENLFTQVGVRSRDV